MSDASIAIQPAQKLPDASPSLMPFHIAYTGPAPFSTYFRVSPAKEPEPQSESTPEGSNALILHKRDTYTASFRGRTLEGTRVTLPDGYAGLVLQSDVPLAAHTTRRPPSPNKPRATSVGLKGRRTRSSTVPDENEPAEDEMDVDPPTDPDLLAENASASRCLLPTGTFDSLIVWGADFAIDEVSDEYVRALHDWTKLAAEIHKPSLAAQRSAPSLE